MNTEKVRVLLAVASPLSAKTLERMLLAAPDIEIAAIARHGREALALLPTTRPHLVCADDALPLMNGFEMAREIMRQHPCPVLILSSSPDEKARQAALEAGALDCIARPLSADEPEARIFIARLKMLSRVPVIGRRPSPAPVPASLSIPRVAEVAPSSNPPELALPLRGIVAIGASTGGPGALMTVLSALPGDFPFPIVCVQHISKGFLDGLLSWLDASCRVQVRLAQDGEIAPKATVLFAPEDHHLEVGAQGRVHLSSAPPCDGHRPSATVLFESVARSFGSRATAILLTGMGSDGASGLLAVQQTGGDTFAQDEASCVVFGMPRIAIELGAAKHVCSPEDIARRLTRI